MPAIVVAAKVGDKPNFMTAAWCGIASLKPPTLMVGIHRDRYTLKGIKENGTFSVNVASADLVKKVDYCGIYSGKDKDKSQVFSSFYGVLKTAPLIEECPVNLECQVKHSLDLGSHIAFIGEIIETHISQNCLTNGKRDTKKIDPLLFTLIEQEYQRQGEFVARAFQIGK